MNKIEITKEKQPSEQHIFFLYFCYISMSLLIITSILDLWTALASLGMFFLILICPFITATIAYKNFKKIKTSTAHKKVFYFSFFYSVGILITIIVSQILY